MRRSRLCLLILAVVLQGAGAPAVRAETPTGSDSPGSNIFSTPDTNTETPTFTKVPSSAPGAKLRQALLGNTRDKIPDFKQIQMLPTLSLQQRRQLKELNKGNKVRVQQLIEQLKKMKEQRDTAGGAVSAEMRAQFEQVRGELQAIRRQSWEQSKALLSDAQIRDIEAMKRGELQPSTFRGVTPSASSGTDMMTGQ